MTLLAAVCFVFRIASRVASVTAGLPIALLMVVLVAVSVVSNLTLAATPVTPRLATSLKASQLAKQEKRERVPWYRVGSGLTYSALADLADEREPRQLSHSLKASGEFSLLDPENQDSERFHFGIEAEGRWRSYAASVDAEQSVVELSDIEASAGSRFHLGETTGARHSLSVDGGVAFPTSLESQYEGVKSVPFAAAEFGSQFGRIGLANSFSGQFVTNTFAYSPVSKTVNPDWSGSYGLRLSASLSRLISASVGASVKYTHHIDDSSLVTFQNYQMLMLRTGEFTIGVRHANGSHSHTRDASLWYYDRYRRLVAAFLKYEF